MNIIDNVEFSLLYDVNASKNTDLPYWKYTNFDDLDSITVDESKTEFRFLKNDIYLLKEALHVPDEIVTCNRLVVHGTEALCIALKWFAYPCRYCDMIPWFARPVPELFVISKYMIGLIYNSFSHLLSDLNQQWLSSANLELYAQVIHQKGAALDNCWGFIDGTVRPVCRPGKMQRVLYNRHKKVHAVRFQSVVIPNGLIANLLGPVDGICHDKKFTCKKCSVTLFIWRSYISIEGTSTSTISESTFNTTADRV